MRGLSNAAIVLILGLALIWGCGPGKQPEVAEEDAQPPKGWIARIFGDDDKIPQPDSLPPSNEAESRESAAAAETTPSQEAPEKQEPPGDERQSITITTGQPETADQGQARPGEETATAPTAEPSRQREPEPSTGQEVQETSQEQIRDKPDEAATPTETGQEPAKEEAEEAPPLCLYLVWSRDLKPVLDLQERLEKDEIFAAAARRVVEKGTKGASLLNATCMPRSEIDPLLLKQVQDLKVGQVGSPFNYQDGTALVMRTTDQYWEKGKQAYQDKDYEAAQEYFQKHLELHPDSMAAWRSLAECQEAQDKLEEALQSLNRALEWFPEDVALLNDKGSLLMKLGDASTAEAAFDLALAKRPNNPLLMHNLAWALLQQNKNLERAQELAVKAIKAHPGQAMLHDTLGQIQRARGEHAAAVISFHRSIRLGSKNQATREDLVDSLGELPVEQVALLSGRPTAKAAPPAKPAKPVKKRKKTRPKATAQAKPPAPAPPKKIKVTVLPHKAEATAPPKPASAAPAQTEKAPDKPVVAASVPKPSIPGFYLLVASFRSPNLAKKEMLRWRKRGQAVWLEPVVVQGRGTWTRVMLGPWQKAAEARRMGLDLRAEKLIKEYRILHKTAISQ